MKEDELDETCSRHGDMKNSYKVMVRKSLEGNGRLGGLSVDWRIK
jgi:hypothetical protein